MSANLKSFQVIERHGRMYYVFSSTTEAWEYFELLRKSVVCRIVCFGAYENAIEF